MSTTLDVDALVAHVAEVTGLPLMLVDVVVERRGKTLAKVRTADATFALKIARETADVKLPVQQLLRHEARILQALPAPYAESVHGTGDSDDVTWLLLTWHATPTVMRHAEKLRELSDDTARQEGFVALFGEIINAVQQIHTSGYLHGDLQPSHLLQDDDGRVHLLDFELALPLTSMSSDDDFAYPGAFTYFVSPETATDMLADALPTTYDRRSEIYALGVTLYVLYARQFPVRYPDALNTLSYTEKLQAAQRNNILPFAEAPHAQAFPALEAILQRCLQGDPTARYATLAEVQAGLNAINSV